MSTGVCAWLCGYLHRQLGASACTSGPRELKRRASKRHGHENAFVPSSSWQTADGTPGLSRRYTGTLKELDFLMNRAREVPLALLNTCSIDLFLVMYSMFSH